LSPISLAGSSSRKLAARASSTSWHSADEALSTVMASGRLLSAATATIFVPFPRRVGPMAKPPFWRSRRLHPRTLPLDSACLARAAMAPAAAALPPASYRESTAGSGGGRSGKADTCPAVHATALQFPAPTAHRSTPHACRARDDLAAHPQMQAAAPALTTSTVLRSTPSVLPSRTRGDTRATPE